MQRLGAPAKKCTSTAKLFLKSGPLQKIGVCPHERPLLRGVKSRLGAGKSADLTIFFALRFLRAKLLRHNTGVFLGFNRRYIFLFELDNIAEM